MTPEIDVTLCWSCLDYWNTHSSCGVQSPSCRENTHLTTAKFNFGPVKSLAKNEKLLAECSSHCSLLIREERLQVCHCGSLVTVNHRFDQIIVHIHTLIFTYTESLLASECPYLIWAAVSWNGSNLHTCYCMDKLWCDSLAEWQLLFYFGVYNLIRQMQVHFLLWCKLIQWCQANGMLKRKLVWSLQALVSHRNQSAFYQMDHLVCRGWQLQNFSLVWLQHSVNDFPITLHKVLSQFPCFSFHWFTFSPSILLFLIPYVMFFYFYFSAIVSISSPSLSNVECYPSFF